MKCGKAFLRPDATPKDLPGAKEVERPVLPDTLTDCLTGREIPFSNRDNIRQKILGFLLEEKGYRKEDFSVDREIRFDLDVQKVVSLVDISVVLGGRTVMVWKCASGSLVSRERQVLASARLLEDYIIPFAAVTNGIDLEFLDSLSGKIIGCGFGAIPARDELMKSQTTLPVTPVNKNKLLSEQRILYTYDAISCPTSCAHHSGG